MAGSSGSKSPIEFSSTSNSLLSLAGRRHSSTLTFSPHRPAFSPAVAFTGRPSSARFKQTLRAGNPSVRYWLYGVLGPCCCLCWCSSCLLLLLSFPLLSSFYVRFLPRFLVFFVLLFLVFFPLFFFFLLFPLLTLFFFLPFIILTSSTYSFLSFYLFCNVFFFTVFLLPPFAVIIPFSP